MTANILIVDDLEPNIKVLEAKLLNEYYTVFTASSGLKALKILGDHKIDIVLLDVMMPIMDGFEVCKKIKANPDTAYIPVIMVTALSDVENKVKGLEAGADDFLTKPINDMALFAQVKSLSRIKTVIDELKLRNQTNAEFGKIPIELIDDFSNSKIAIINDDVAQTKNICTTLNLITSKIQVISQASDLDLFEHYTPDIIIISSQLSNSDPLRICSNLKTKYFLQHSIIIFLAEEEDVNIVIKGMELGINDYFIYPVDANELAARIKTQLRKKYYQDNLRHSIDQEMSFAIKDGLTSLFNRRYFDLHIQHLTNQSTETKIPYCLLMLDIDHFKLVNDNFGHQAGDKLLKSIAKILELHIRITDLTARYGGEEFAIVLSNTNLNEASVIANRIRQSIETTDFEISHNTIVKKSVSIGVALYKPNETSFEFIERADKALYTAKISGRNRVELAL